MNRTDHQRMAVALSLVFTLLSGSLFGQKVQLTVTNPSSVDRKNEPVLIPWKDVVGKIPGITRDAINVTAENGSSVSVQVDDLDQDGMPDELVFAADFRSGQSRSFTLSAGKSPYPSGTLRTDAANWKRIDGVLTSVDDDDGPGLKRDQSKYRFDGVGWESEVVGYRVYLDERNAVDIQGKRKAGLHWNFIGSTDVDYQADADWGMDVLHVGPALGMGGIGLWVGDSVHKPVELERRRCRIIARGPVRAVVRVDYLGWEIGDERVDVASAFTILAGDRVSEHRVELLNSSSPQTLATGIVKHAEGTPVWVNDGPWLVTRGRQSRSNDELLMALTFRADDLIRKANASYDHVALLRLVKGRPVTFLMFALWQGETGKMWDDGEIRTFLARTSARLNKPLTFLFD